MLYSVTLKQVVGPDHSGRGFHRGIDARGRSPGGQLEIQLAKGGQKVEIRDALIQLMISSH